LVDTSIAKHLRGLSRALAQNRTNDVYTHHRDLYLIGKEVIPHVSDQLLAYSWRTVKFGEQLRLLSGLLSLAHDIDEVAARRIAERIEEKGCSHAVRGIVHSIFSFSLDHFDLFSVEGVSIYRSKELAGVAQTIKSRVTKWLRTVPDRDLDGVDRIYVVPSCGSHARGAYTPVLCTIAIQWDAPANPFSRWFWLLRVEYTLYHEIGHHVRRHNKLGQDPDQEDEADDYAKKLIKKNHPFFRRVAKVLVRGKGSTLIGKTSGRSGVVKG